MDAIIGIQGKDFTLLCTDRNAARSIMIFKRDEDKIVKLDEHKLMACAGPVGDCNQFSQYIQKNLALQQFRFDVPLSVHATSHYIRGELAQALRSDPYQVNLMIGGWDSVKGPSLYYCDYLASMQKVPFGAHGYISHFVLSVLDRYYKEDMSEEQAVEVLKKCIKEIKTRFLISLNDFTVKIANKDGIREIKPFDAVAPVQMVQEE